MPTVNQSINHYAVKHYGGRGINRGNGRKFRDTWKRNTEEAGAQCGCRAIEEEEVEGMNVQ